MIRKDRGELLEQDILIAQERFANFKTRMDATLRVPPRAIGHDAP